MTRRLPRAAPSGIVHHMHRRHTLLLGFSALAGLVGSAGAQARSRWRDPAPHRSQTMTVARGVKLEVLDWGGTGPPLVFLAGLGNTAHAWDTFIPRFTDKYHAVAITRRGFGASSHPADGYDLTTLVNDVRVVLDNLKLQRVVLVGHSIAAEELTRFAATYPSRVSKLIYLDGAYDRPAMDSIVDELFTEPVDIPSMPAPASADTGTVAGYVDYVHRTRGVDIPEADIRARYTNDGWDESKTYYYNQVGIVAERPKYAQVRAPALAVYSVIDSVDQMEPWVRADRERRENQQKVLDKLEIVYAFGRDEFRREVKRGEVLEIHGGHHWIFLSHAERVAQAMRAFLARE
jgi:pimeloyl-ACP methyl ester carboxylesterase